YWRHGVAAMAAPNRQCPFLHRRPRRNRLSDSRVSRVGDAHPVLAKRRLLIDARLEQAMKRIAVIGMTMTARECRDAVVSGGHYRDRGWRQLVRRAVAREARRDRSAGKHH